ncbi:MAG: xylulokinase [Synergistaceae bacterium]|jgi:xylulokinase|nr:xylulokinase [Synergistaceae bacterium]
MKVYLGIDVGTTSIKALAVDASGKVAGSFSHPLSLLAPHPAWAEQDPESWWEGVMSLLRAVPKDMKVERIGLSGQMHTLVPLDKDGKVLRNAILWCDQRTASECEAATRELGGEERVIELTGNPIYPGFTLPKILWLRNQEPEIYGKMATCLIAKDFVAYRLTGEMGSDHSDASGSAMYDVIGRKWNTSLLGALKIDPKLLPPLQSSFEVRGRLRKDLAQQLDWDAAEVVAGGADNAVSALGVGVCQEGDCMVSIGTSGTVLGIAKGGTLPDKSGKLHFFNHAAPDVSYHMGVMLAAASSLNWFKDKMGRDFSWPQVEAGIAAAPIGADGLLWLPYLQGERTPHRDPNARGVLFGLSAMTNEMRVFRAVMEGITYGLRDSFELLKEQTAIRRVLVVGGGAKNAEWRKMLAGNMKVPVAVPVIDEGGAYGAAMLAAMGGGADLTMVKNWVKESSVTEPNETNYAEYDAVYEQFKALYVDLKPRFDAVAALNTRKR